MNNKELERNEELLYNCIEYLIDLWGINENKQQIKEHFKAIGFTDEDIATLELDLN